MRQSHGSSLRHGSRRLSLSIRAVADALGCSPRRVCTLIEDGELRALRWGGHRRVSALELERYVAARAGSGTKVRRSETGNDERARTS